MDSRIGKKKNVSALSPLPSSVSITFVKLKQPFKGRMAGWGVSRGARASSVILLIAHKSEYGSGVRSAHPQPVRISQGKFFPLTVSQQHGASLKTAIELEMGHLKES